MMDCANQKNLVRCGSCDALYDKTLKWVRGYSHGTSEDFTVTSKVKENSCPVCGKKRK